ncbi:unnamed protein product [Danaus chrysippus]|uniref:(African queen) hypothetical protein n=1 Tax=Danaus chrysippus TaxID=151541 RepID=A0A8J2VTP7_9NEOP|nr:unnamed protein product [Danaus chrysippus]
MEEKSKPPEHGDYSTGSTNRFTRSPTVPPPVVKEPNSCGLDPKKPRQASPFNYHYDVKYKTVPSWRPNIGAIPHEDPVFLEKTGVFGTRSPTRSEVETGDPRVG